jgi:hypothetical protein
MKWPRFSLRLMLLIVALFAALFGWRRAIAVKAIVEREGQRSLLESRLVVPRLSLAALQQRNLFASAAELTGCSSRPEVTVVSRSVRMHISRMHRS